MKIILLILSTILFMSTLHSQDTTASELNKLPYYEIPDYPEDYSAGNVAARVADGLGYRFYWATEGLTDENLDYKPSDDSRTILETLEHIFRLTRTSWSVAKNEMIVRLVDEPVYEFEELRKLTLENIEGTSILLRGKSPEELAELTMVFQREDRTSQFPFWNLLNGPLADAIYHTGQIVAFRRAAGNPVDFRMNVFTGKNR
jgi:uncharacterized damage-inducible protein DinB